MNRLLTLILALIISFSAYAQHQDEKNIKNKTHRAIVQIKRLKEGALLVRLFEKSRQIELLKKQGKSDQIINAYKAKIKAENDEIIDAFKTKFTFCPVYFFYSKDTEHVKSRDFKNMNFLENQDVSTLSDGYFYTADVSAARVDTSSYFVSHNGRDENDNIITIKGRKSRVTYEAVVLRSDQFIDLLSPFPYSVRTYKDLPIFKRPMGRVVEKLNDRLQFFYEKYENIEVDPTTYELIVKPVDK